LSLEDAECRADFEKNELTEASVTALREQKNLVDPSASAYNNRLGLDISQICAPEGQTHVDRGVGSKAKSNRRENPALNHGTRPVLLIVDDEPLGLKSMASVFEGQGYELVLAGSGHEAMQFVETGRPDVILLDVMMPGMDGLETCRRIRSHPGMAEIPILLVTALDDRRSRLEGLESGADDYITKPIDRAEVRARVRTITRLNRFRRLQKEIVYSRQTMAELREYSRRLDLLRRIDRAILMADSAAEIAGQVLPLLRDLIPHSHAAIYRQEPRGQTLTLLAEDGAGQPLAKLEDQLEIGDLGVAFETGPESFCPVILLLGRGAKLPVVPRQLHAAGIDVLMAIPLGHHDRVLGVLLLGGPGPARFSEPQTEIAQEVGGIISLALAHTELLENVTRGRSQLESLSHKLILVREEESRRIARELHDEIGQILAVLNLNLAAIKKGVGSEIAREAVDGSLDLVARLITKVRRLSLDLHPSLLDDFGLVTALRRHVESLADRTGLDLRFQADEGIGRLDTELETVCYRVVQEAITNALRHAEPVHLLIRLRLDAGKLELSVSDDGRGFDPEAALERSAGGQSLGLLGMRERVSLVSGELSIISAPGAGAVIKASFPLIKNLGKDHVP
jgi:signal transduction histidine kinase